MSKHSKKKNEFKIKQNISNKLKKKPKSEKQK